MYFAISACLAGFICRYDGKNQANPIIEKLYKKGYALPVCPEVLGGLSVPRTPCEMLNGKIIDKNGIDHTFAFLQGAFKASVMIKNSGCQVAILKSKSPSCGYGKIYDGTFTKRLVDGSGLLAQILIQNPIKIFTDENFIQKLTHSHL